RSLAPSGLWWTAGFAIYLSFFATVIPLSLFGKTVGMALTGLDARGGAEMPPLTFVESSRRWVGTFAAVAGLGVPLLVGRQPGLPSLADRLSGRPVVYEEVDSP
ncbi:MAG TPA: RDD family protein, partial [Thermoanaerobaculia bacterium]|nr:RDD family protein [Thermoanaerobaculia bacterium]